jgi:hypothetical protein
MQGFGRQAPAGALVWTFWAEKIDAALETKDREIAQLSKRIADLENRLKAS